LSLSDFSGLRKRFFPNEDLCVGIVVGYIGDIFAPACDCTLHIRHVLPNTNEPSNHFGDFPFCCFLAVEDIAKPLQTSDMVKFIIE